MVFSDAQDMYFCGVLTHMEGCIASTYVESALQQFEHTQLEQPPDNRWPISGKSSKLDHASL